MKDGKVRIGLIGTGQIGKHHLDRYAKIPEAEIVAVCDIRDDEMARVAQKYNVPDQYHDYHDLLAREDIDSVDVCVHNFLHAPITIDALKAGKNVYCEKPMSWTYADAKDMYDTAQQLKKMLHIQLATIYEPETKAARRLMEEGYLGDIYYVKCYTHRRRNRPWVDGYGAKEFVNTKTSGGGTLLDMAVYSLGRMMYLLDAPEVLTVSGAKFQKIDMYEDRRKIGDFNVEELGVALVRLANGVVINLESSWAIHSAPPEGDCLLGSRGGVRMDPFTYFTTIGDMEMDGTFDLETANWRWHQCNPPIEAYDDSQKHWIWAQLGRVELLPTALYALRTAQIAEGVYLSARKGCEVSVEEINAAPGGFPAYR
ncbi:MAG: gfo/Idh/MocA family oxidoreductase [Chloroflexi bacterium]|nr:MAG: gfo/Idh/MocA family oxidoreductase [Chloroflexota bacterium]